MIDHTNHPHPSTPKARALCRANGGTGSIAKVGTSVPKTSPAKAKVSAKPVINVDTGKPITQQEAAKIMFGTRVGSRTVKAAQKSGVGKKLELTNTDRDRLQKSRDEQKARLARITARQQKPSVKDSYESGIASSQKLSGGVTAKTELDTTNSGTKLVVKTTSKKGNPPYADPVRQNDAEELTSLLGRTLGVKVPEVHRVAPRKVAIEYFDGVESLVGAGSLQRKRDLADSKEGLKLGLLDLVTDQTDRHDGNWLVDSDGQVKGIDHSYAWGYVDHAGNPVSPKEPKRLVSWVDKALGIVGRDEGVFNLKLRAQIYNHFWQDTDKVSKADIQTVRDRLKSIKSEFQRTGRLDWYQASLDRLDAMEPFAKGKGRIFE